ncbi:hypothetical protein SSP531S_09690 [Streptomyces spongiicola]|uniref:Uncharacterized protein n=1 Tax=Streptomyces spongiicola TaxID=1690221 RepID=A0A388SX52_9ACTN|nr:hypothetical protein SSP531S_09690 [Streptomyces spongiicola]
MPGVFERSAEIRYPVCTFASGGESQWQGRAGQHRTGQGEAGRGGTRPAYRGVLGTGGQEHSRTAAARLRTRALLERPTPRENIGATAQIAGRRLIRSWFRYRYGVAASACPGPAAGACPVHGRSGPAEPRRV